MLVDEDLACCILSVIEEYSEAPTPRDSLLNSYIEVDGVWNIYFDGEY